MTVRERILNILKGNEADRMPLTSYDSLWRQAGIQLDDERLMKLRKKGLGIIKHIETYSIKTPHVEWKNKSYIEDGNTMTVQTLSTPIGDISSMTKNGWTQEHFLKSPEDYRIMEYIIKDQKIVPAYDHYNYVRKEIGDDGIVVISSQRSPYQMLLVDYAGLEQFSYHMADEFDEIYSLYDALLVKMRETIEVICNGPGDVIKLWENITGDAIGSSRYEEFHLPVYEQIFPLINSSGKLLAVHYDGRLECLKEPIKRGKFDIIESFTPPPEGDVELCKAFEYWPDKAFWLTIPAHAYSSDSSIQSYMQYIKEVSVGKSVVPEIAEYFPEHTWQNHVEIMLDELN